MKVTVVTLWEGCAPARPANGAAQTVVRSRGRITSRRRICQCLLLIEQQRRMHERAAPGSQSHGIGGPASPCDTMAFLLRHLHMNLQSSVEYTCVGLAWPPDAGVVVLQVLIVATWA